MLLTVELRADARLRSCASRDEPLLVVTRSGERAAVHRDRMLEADHLIHDGRVLCRDRLHRLDAADEIVDALCAEQYCKLRLIVTRRVDRNETLRQRDLRLPEVRARRAQADLVDLQAVLDRVQLRARRFVGALSTMQARVELLDLAHDLLGLGLLRADVRVAGRRAGRDESRSYPH